MIELSLSVEIHAKPDKVWRCLCNMNKWWVLAHINHISFEVNNPDKALKLGSEIAFTEIFCGLPIKGRGKITYLSKETAFAWAGHLIYRKWGLDYTAFPCVIYWLEGTRKQTTLSVNLWIAFPETFRGKASEWLFTHFMKGQENSYKHLMKELLFVKQLVENSQPETNAYRQEKEISYEGN